MPTDPLPPASYSTDADGGAPVSVRMQLQGDFGPGYADFVADRAAWLSLSGWIERPAADRAVIVAAGPQALVGALEMACMLGPIDTLIHTLESQDHPHPVPQCFTVRG